MSNILKEFEADCAQWYRWGERGRNHCEARIKTYKALCQRYGPAAVSRHQLEIMQILNRAELKYAKGGARKILCSYDGWV